jgi:hypothetical protein
MSRMSRSYISSSPSTFMAFSGTALAAYNKTEMEGVLPGTVKWKHRYG